MSTLDEAIAAQENIAVQIKAIYDKFKKDGTAQKTHQYVSSRRENLERLWNEFKKAHNNLKEDPEHDYFKTRYYNQVESIYKAVVEVLDKRRSELDKMQASSASDGSTTIVSNIEQLQRFRRQQDRMSSIQRIKTEIEENPEASSEFKSVKIDRLNCYWEKFEAEHDTIVSQAAEKDRNESYFRDEIFVQVESLYQNALISAAQQRPSAELRPQRNGYNQDIRLPRIVIPTFSGSYTAWRSYHDLFTAMVHDNHQLSPVQKLQYLKTTLIEEPSLLIKHLPLTNESYLVAWRLLVSRYENKKLLVNAQLKMMMSLPKINHESSQDIKRLLDSTTECLLSLQGLEIDTHNWDAIVVFITVQRLPSETHQRWEEISNTTTIPTWKDLQNFLETRFHTLEAIKQKDGRPSERKQKGQTALISNSTATCFVCKKQHSPLNCDVFLKLSPKERFDKVKESNRCVNCLLEGHSRKRCSATKCKKCKRSHNTLLHFEKKSEKKSVVEIPATNLSATSQKPQTREHIFLATAIIQVLDKNGQLVKCRAMLDSGSQLNFITESLIRKLGLNQRSSNMRVSGIGAKSSIRAQRRTVIKIQSITSGFSTELETFILETITNDQPVQEIPVEQWPIPKNIVLADSAFNKPSKIDLLIGAELFCNLLMVGQINMGESLPTLQNTLFGWVILGRAKYITSGVPFCGIGVKNLSLDNQITKFWEIEEKAPIKTVYSQIEQNCEQHFIDNTKRSDNGKFIVRLPFAQDCLSLGNSKDMAMRRFLALEKRFSRNSKLFAEYSKFMKEYIQLKHMEEVSNVEADAYFIPHHCVMKPSSTSTKLRVVFDASAKTTTNLSLNDILIKGPVIQDDLFSIMVRFRTHKYVFTSDIEKMYRQIEIDTRDRKWQVILWRDSPEDNIKYYRLKTITYGTTPASFLATRCLQELAMQEQEFHPLASVVVKRDFYMDDVMTGANNLTEVMKLQSQLISLLSLGGFSLHKWCANHPQLLKYIPNSKQELELNFGEKDELYIKTLGVTWIPKSDHFLIKTNFEETKLTVTKRTVLADTARIFDPLGLVNPVIVLAKIFMQELWTLKLDWDASLPNSLHTKWISYRKEIIKLNSLKISRHILIDSSVNIQLHAFSDASERAYGAAVYLRSTDIHGNVLVNLVGSKSRVAPLKKQTLPRLELCAANLMVQFAHTVTRDLCLKIDSTHYWTDSEIVLSWITTTSHSLKTFVANRVAEIQEMTKSEDWNHISSKENPADLISRGVFPEELICSKKWFHGPSFLGLSPDQWPERKITSFSKTGEEKKLKTVLISNENADLLLSINHRNSFRCLRRVMAYCLRFIRNSRLKNIDRATELELSIEEIKQASIQILKKVQQQQFSDEILQLVKKGQVNKTSPLSSLTPFLDNVGLIRVGGRIQASTLSYESKHPILLPHISEVTKLIINQTHIDNLHAGPQALLCIIRQNYWPLNGKRLAKNVVNNCVLCSRSRPKCLQQLMGNLPAARVTPSRPFSFVGIDFAGPIMIHFKLRGKRPIKSYICIFVCFSTKAVHIEVCSDLSTGSFIACLKRFISRRGKPVSIYCDNATNFVGAKNELQELNQLMQDKKHQTAVVRFCSNTAIEWKFIPPRSPHFGGLWEAAVKSAKNHLRKILCSAWLTFEELTTVAAEVEAILNSRPLTAMSTNPNDLQALTPGHFLIGAPMTAINESESSKNPINRTWDKIKALKHEFWKRWEKEYLHELQVRYKWNQPKNYSIPVGTLVLLKEDNTPPLRWHMARVTNVHTGSDGAIRVVDLKTQNGNTSRAIHNICPLPVDQKNRAEEETTNTVRPAKKPPNKRKGPRINPISKVLLLTCLIVGLIQSAECLNNPELFNVTHFSNSPGLYHENIGKISLTSGKWHILTYFQLDQLWEEEDRINEAIDKLNQLCSNKITLGIRLFCEVTAEQINHQKDMISQKNQLIKSSYKPRSKRGLVNVIGVLSKELFGTLDYQDGQRFDEEISKSRENEKHLLTLIKKQTTIIECTKNIMQKNNELTYRQFELFRKQIESLQNGETEQTFLCIVVHLIMLINGYQETQNNLLDVLTQMNDGRIPLALLSPEQLKVQLEMIKKKIPHNLIIPGDTEDRGILSLYQILRARGTIVNNRLIVDITIPLIVTEKMDLFKLIPVPVQQKDNLAFIKPVAEYMAINFKEERYHFLHEIEIHECQTLETNYILCEQIGPMYNSQGSKIHCEMSILTGNNKIPSICQFEKANYVQMWIPLAKGNLFIFVLDYEYDMTIIFKDIVIKSKLAGAGLIQLLPGAMIKLNNMEVTTSDTWQTKLVSSIQISANINNVLATRPVNKTNEDNTIKNSSQMNFKYVEDRIQLIKQEEELPNTEVSSHDIHHYTSIYVIGLCIVALVVYQVLHRKSNRPVPAVRTLQPIILNEELVQDIELREFNAGENV